MRIKYGENGYGAYLNEFYREEEIPTSSIRHRSLLLSLPFHDVIEELYAYGCDLVRRDILVPVLPMGRNPSDAFAMNLKFLAKHPDILNLTHEGLVVISENGEEKTLEFDTHMLSNCGRFSRFLLENKVRAVTLREGVYRDGIGVRLVD